MSFITPILCDRRVYAFKGKWKSPNNDIEDNVYYFIKEPLSMTSSYENGREELKETITITAFGTKPYAVKDFITLQNGVRYEIQAILPNFLESNILVRDMLKQRYASVDLILG